MAAAVVACTLATVSFHAAPSYRTARSADGAAIAYEVSGVGQTTLVFVHGWSCNRSHWRFQVDAFSKDHRVVVLDLAGHGDSGRARSVWSITNFAQDVAAVMNAIDAKNAVLIGHSMGGPVVLEAALLQPRRVIGVIGVDATTMFDGSTAQGLGPMIERMRTDFDTEARAFARGMFRPASDPWLAKRVVDEMARMPPKVGISSLQGLAAWGTTRQTVAASALSARVGLLVAGNKPTPTFFTAGKGASLLVGIERMPDAGHFLMLEDPAGFNRRLRALIERIPPAA
jgi:pimeloyl-ACP methyl ester carboxylesterase